MKISYNWLKEYIDLAITPEETDKLLTGTGLEVEDISDFYNIPGGLEGIVVGHVLERKQHPNADKLSVCLVDIGSGEPKQIVCGAPNVAAGQKVLVATVGATVHPSKGEPFEIKKAKIRGEVSEGMICAEDELSLGDSHDGIMILPEHYEIGAKASKYFPIYKDYLIEIGLTANRGDAASHLGVARDLHALTGASILKPTIQLKASNKPCPIQVEIQYTEACKRYSGIYVSGTKVQESPEWLKNKLSVLGLKPINHIVDVTNYVLHGIGQPLHAFDADKISGNKIIVKAADAGSTFISLDGIERKLFGHECMIADQYQNLALAGVFGGKDSGIESTTTNIFIESAFFSGSHTRKSAKSHGLNTDASFRFERGTDPEITLFACEWAASLIAEIGGGEISQTIDVYPEKITPAKIQFNISKSNQLIGQEIAKDRIIEILSRLEIKILADQGNELELEVPAYRSDVNRQADITEEILRIYGLNNIEMGNSIKSSMSFSEDEFGLKLKNKLATHLSANGFLEIATNSLTKSNYYSEEELKTAVFLKNPLSSDLDILRLNMMNSTLEAIQYNNNRKQSDLRFYEFGKSYHKNGDENQLGAYIENKHLILASHGRKQPESWNTKNDEFGYYQLKQVIEQLLELSGFDKWEWKYPDESGLLNGAEIHIKNQKLGLIGEIDSQKTKKFDIDKSVWFADIDWDNWMKLAKDNKFKLKPVSVYPAVRRDLALLLDEQVAYRELEKIARKSAGNLLKTVNIFDFYQGDKIEKGKKSYALSFILQDDNKTLTDQEIDDCMKKLIVQFEKEVGAKLRA
ncbi:MAG: phenylalanine--tRNA ligase subunit beta [Bacteroidia bacterium]